MATLRCDHPDIGRFIDAKRDERELRHFNLSVLVTDAMMEAVERDEDWPLVFPVSGLDGQDRTPGKGSVTRQWSGTQALVPCQVLDVVRARDLWDGIMRATYGYAEPGVLFIDRINHQNNLGHREQITATNPCGEIPLPAYGACNLGSVNLTRFVMEPFTEAARLDTEGIAETVRVAVRLMDNVIDASRFPVPAQAEQARGARRIGLGFTGLADALIMLGVAYGDPDSYRIASEIMQGICLSAYRSSVALAREKGPFPFFEKTAYLEAPFVRALPDDVRAGITEFGIRNSHLTAIAPTGTISLLANNVSSGVEPVFNFHYTRRVLEADGDYAEHELSDYAWRLWRTLFGDRPPSPAFVDASRITPVTNLEIQAAVQPHVDNAISKTVNVPVDLPFSELKSIYRRAYELGLKGCTTFRPNPVTGAILSAERMTEVGAHCCDIEREGD